MVISLDNARRAARLIALVCLLPFQQSGYAQEVTATARVDSNAIVIGDWLNVTIDVLHPGTVAVGAPELPDSLPGFELVKRESLPASAAAGQTLDRMILTLTAFDSGSYEFPALTIPFTAAGDTARQIARTLPIVVVVHGVAVDTSLAIKDIKPPMSLPVTFMEILPYLVGALLVAGIVWLIVYIRKKRRKGESILPAAPPRPPHEVALEQLIALERDHLWQQGKIKEFHSRVTEIIRRYIEDRFQVMALEQTTEEILGAEVIALLPKEPKAHLESMLVRADLVKFAKHVPPQEEHAQSLGLAKEFVESTIERVEARAAAPAPQEASA